MNTERLIKIAEALDTSLLNKIAISDIIDYHIDVIQDDNRIEIIMVKNVPIKNIKVTLSVKRV